MKLVQLEIKNAVAVVRLNRPKVHNVINDDVMRDLESTLDKIEGNSGVRTVILTGAGGQSFCAGADLKYLDTLKERKQALQMAERMQAILSRLYEGPRVVIAAINGSAYGGGCEILTACHLRIAVPNAIFEFRHAEIGLSTAWGGGLRLFHLVGESQALRLLLTGEAIDAKEALRIGFVQRVADCAEKAANDLADEVNRRSPTAIRAFLEIPRLATPRDRKAAQERETELFGDCWESPYFSVQENGDALGAASRTERGITMNTPDETLGLERIDNLYRIHLRAYFDTFRTYTTATTILVATLGFVLSFKPHWSVFGIIMLSGMYLCFQWHISTCTMRDQYRFFRREIVKWEKGAHMSKDDPKLVSQWMDQVKAAICPEKYPKPKDSQNLTSCFRQLDHASGWGLRAASLPIIYSAMFVALGAGQILDQVLPMELLPVWQADKNSTADGLFLRKTAVAVMVVFLSLSWAGIWARRLFKDRKPDSDKQDSDK